MSRRVVEIMLNVEDIQNVQKMTSTLVVSLHLHTILRSCTGMFELVICTLYTMFRVNDWIATVTFAMYYLTQCIRRSTCIITFIKLVMKHTALLIVYGSLKSES